MGCSVVWSGSALGVPAPPSCSSESRPRRQEVISRRGYTSPISVADGCLSPRYRSEDCAWGGAKRSSQSMGAFHSPCTTAFLILNTDWSGRLRYCGDFFVFSALCSEKEWVESDEHFVVGSLLSFSRMCMAYVRGSCCVPPTLPRTHRSRSEV